MQVDEAIELNFQKAFRTSLDLKNETLEESFEEVINKLSNLSGKKLLVIDDLKVASDSPSLRAILGLAHCGFTLLFTSRTTFPHLPHRFVEHLPLPQAKELFGKHYPKAVEEEKLEQLLRIIDSHTLLIELIAKIMVEGGYALEKILTQLSQGAMARFWVKNGSREREIGYFFNQLGFLYDSIGAYSHALGYLQRSLAILQAIGDKSGEGTTLNNISQIYDARGDYATALTYLQQSLAIRQAIGDKSGEGTTLNNISQIYDARGDYATALTYLQQSLAIRQAIGDKSGEGSSLNNIGQIYRARGDLTTALTYLQRSLTISQAIGDKSGMCATLFNIGHIHWANDENDQAIQN